MCLVLKKKHFDKSTRPIKDILKMLSYNLNSLYLGK